MHTYVYGERGREKRRDKEGRKGSLDVEEEKENRGVYEKRARWVDGYSIGRASGGRGRNWLQCLDAS